MASPITQRVRAAFTQSKDKDLQNQAPDIVVNDSNQLGYNLANKSQLGTEAPALVEASEGKVTGQMAGPKMSDENWKKYLAQESPERKAERLQQQQDAGVREGVVTQDDADAQNAANQEANNENKEYGNFKPIELENKYQDVQSRSEVMNQVRRNRSLQRNIKRENNKARRALNKKERRGTLSDQDVKDLKYYNDNRYTSGTGGNVVRDADGNITGSSLENAMGDMSRSIGTQLKTSGGSLNNNANRSRIEEEGLSSNNNQTAGAGAAKKASKLPKTGYAQKPYSGFQQVDVIGKDGKKYTFLDQEKGTNPKDFKVKGSKVNSGMVPYEGPKVKSLGTGAPKVKVSGGTKLLNKVNKGLNALPDRGNVGLLKKVGLGLTGLGLGYLGYKVATGSSKPPGETGDGDVKPKKGKSYDQAYQDRDRKTYGHMNKSNYIKEAKRQNDVFAKTGKWDYKNAPKDPGPVSTIKPAKVAPVSTNVKPTADVNLDKISQPERKPTISNKQGKALNKLSKLEGRKQTSRRDIRIAKQKDKAAGLSRKQVRQNKQMRKGNFTTTRSSSGSVTGGQAAVNNFINQNENATIKQRENELKSASGFKQKGWTGFQK